MDVATSAGMTVGIDDLVVPPEKTTIIGKAQDEVNRIFEIIAQQSEY